jgi:hypothetical protein
MDFQRAHLLISDAEQNALTSALASVAQADPISVVIQEQVARVVAMTAAYQVPEAWLQSLVRALVLHDLYSRLGPGQVPANIQEAYAEAQKDLTDLRQGRYRNLAIAGAVPPNAPNQPVLMPRPWAHSRDDHGAI